MKKLKKINLPRLEKLTDLRKFLMIIESLEIDKVNHAVNMDTKMQDQITTVDNLKTIKEYYTDVSDFLHTEQSKNRDKDLELHYCKEIETFLNFWKKVFDDFEELSKNEIAKVLAQNKVLAKEMKEILEETTGFKAPPNKDVLTLLAIRKIAKKLKTNDAVKYLNFDHFKKKNKETNEKWVRNRKKLLELRISKFEAKLERELKLSKMRLNKELNKLQYKRQRQFERLATKYQKCKNMASEISAKDSYELKKLKKYFLIRNDIPALTYSETEDNFLNLNSSGQESMFKMSQVQSNRQLEKKIQIEDELDNVSQRTVEKSINKKRKK